jgi:hypothetical protein
MRHPPLSGQHRHVSIKATFLKRADGIPKNGQRYQLALIESSQNDNLEITQQTQFGRYGSSMTSWLRFPLERVKRMSNAEWRELLARQHNRIERRAARKRASPAQRRRMQHTIVVSNEDATFGHLLRKMQRPQQQMPQ